MFWLTSKWLEARHIAAGRLRIAERPILLRVRRGWSDRILIGLWVFDWWLARLGGRWRWRLHRLFWHMEESIGSEFRSFQSIEAGFESARRSCLANRSAQAHPPANDAGQKKPAACPRGGRHACRGRASFACSAVGSGRRAIRNACRACNLFRSRPHRAADRRRQERGRADHLFVGDDRRHAGADRRLRKEIRREDAVLARQLREHPAPRTDRAARRPLRGRRHRDQRRRDGIAASRGHAAGGALAAPRRHRAGGAAPAPRMGRRPAEHHLGRLQHQAGPQGRAAEDLRGFRRSALEGAARDRIRRRRLVRRARQCAGRGEDRQAVPRHGARERRVGAQGPHAARQSRRRAARCSSRSRSITTRRSS